MIAQLSGKIIEKNFEKVVVDVAGVGYELSLSTNSLSKIPAIGNSCTILTFLFVKEDNLKLYGFADVEEKSLFEKLISVSGIGPRVALAILSAHSPDSFKKAVLSEDEDLISSIPRVGKKSAKRIILELKEKLELPKTVSENISTSMVEAREALVSLGYTLNEAQKALGQIKGNGEVTAEELVKQALKQIGRPNRGK